MHQSQELLHQAPTGRILHAGAHYAAAGQDFPMHQHETSWEFVYYHTGRVGCPIGDEWYEGRPGMLLLTPPMTPHAEIAHTAYGNYFLGVDAPREHPWPRVCYDDADQTLAALCRSILKECAAPRADSPMMLDLLMQQMNLLLGRAEARSPLGEPERAIQAALHYMERNYALPLTVPDIALAASVSPSSLYAYFAERRGVSPYASLQTIRVRHAVALLQHSTLTLETVAGNCGFDSASHLTRHVKAATGQTPGRLRRLGQ